MLKKLAAIALLSLSSAAMADRGPYAGIGFGRTSIDVGDTSGFNVTVDDTDSGFKVYGGYQIINNLAIEAGYANLGEATFVFGPAVTAKFEAAAVFVDAVGTLPLTDGFALLGRAGLAFTQAELSATRFGFSASEKEDDVSLKLGLGAQYSFTKNLALRAEWERYLEVGGETTGEADIDIASVSLNVKF